MKKRILLIAPSCYPIHDAESIVNVKMLKAMTKSGDFIIDLVTKKTVNEDYPSSTLEDLGVKINSLNVIDVDNQVTFKSIWGHILSLLHFGIVFKGSHWAAKTLSVVKKLIKENHYDYVLTKSGSSPLVGYYLKRHFDIKWVATWNDPYPMFTYPKIYADHYKAEKDSVGIKMLNIMNKYVDKHIFPSDRLRNHMRKYIGFDEADTVVIPHVVNECQHHDPRYNDNIFRIIHSGNLKYPRDPKVFLEGLRKFLKVTPDAKLEVSILGVADDSLFRLIKENQLQGVVKFVNPVDYVTSLNLLKNYSVALIIEAQCPEGIFMPTKVSDFMQSGIPIFAISPSVGVLHDLYVNGNINYFADNKNVDEVATTLTRMYEDFTNQNRLSNMIPYNFSENYMVEAYQNI